jgi:hypothetical protein
METNSRSQYDEPRAAPPLERRTILLRAYAEAEPAEKRERKLQKPSEWVLVFDTETTDDETQRIRFGTFQLREGERLEIEGIFVDPDATTEAERDVLKAEAARLNCRLFSLREFVDRVFFPAAYDGEATVVCFNQPFDISRLALEARRAPPVYRRTKKGEVRVDRSMVGGRQLNDRIGGLVINN